jgi:hypothetical protein
MRRLCFLIIAFLTGYSHSFAQTGPAGVGSPVTNVLWLKADAGTSSTVSGSPISSWSDQSGNSLGVSQTVSVQQPSYTANMINGFPAIAFDNVNSSGQNDKMFGPDSPLLDNTSGYTFFTVTQPRNLDGSARSIVSKRTGVSIDQSFMLFYYTNNRLYIDLQTTNDRFSSNSVYSSGTNYLSSLVYNGSVPSASRCALYNGETLDRYAAETSTLIPDNNSPLLIGTTDAADPRPFGGYMSEIIIYRQALGTAERVIVNNYLSAKYNIPLAANDYYQGDLSVNGDYDFEVAGIGREASGSSSSFSASVSGGLTISANSGLDVGDYLFAGHAVPVNTTITSDVGGMSGSNRARWQRIWYVQVTNSGTPLNINLEFDMSDGGMSPFSTGPLSSYVLLYRPGLSGNWTEVAVASAIAGDRILFNGLNATSNGYFTLGTRDFHNSPLPVELLSFSASPRGAEVFLEWRTASERNNASFSIERSPDGIVFDSVASVEGAGISLRPLDYQYTDRSPRPGLSYYRLRQTDLDKSVRYSGLVAVELDQAAEAGTLHIVPNPARGSFALEVPASASREISLYLYDAAGKTVLSLPRLSRDEKGFFLVHPPGDIRPGLYFIRVSAGGQHYSGKLIIG